MQHIGIGDDDMPLPADGLARVVRRVAVVSKGFNIGLQIGNQRVYFMHLILRQRLCRKKVEGARFGFVENALQDGQIIAKRLAAGCRCYQDNILTVADEANGLCLMRIEFFEAAFFQYILETRINPGRIFLPVARLCRNFHNSRSVVIKTFVFL